MTTITALPPAPSRSDPVNFSDEADAFVAALPAFGTEANALAAEVNNFASTASTAASTATTQAGIATTKADEASTSASNAAASAAAAAASYDQFDDRWLGAKTSDPAVDNDGNPLTVGVAYFNSTTSLIRIYNGTGWQDALGSVTGQFTILREVQVATGGQTLFNLSNTYVQGINALMVYVNGVRLTNADYTETSTTSITLASPLVAGDEVLVEIGVTNTGSSVAAGIVTFNPAGTIAATNVQTAVQELDSEKVAKSGDTMTGNLNFSGTGLRLTGDFSNATVANRMLFQTNAANTNTIVQAIPSGSGTVARWNVANASDPANASEGSFAATSTEIRVESTLRGTGSYLPMTFYTGGSERLRIDTSGNVGIGTASMAYKFVVSNGGASGIEFGPAYSGTANLIQSYNRSGLAYVRQVYDASDHQFNIAGSAKATLDASGNVGIGVTPSAWNADYRALDIGAAGSFAARIGTSNTLDVVSNAFRNGAGNWVYKATNPASRINVDGSSGSIFFSRAASGTAGNTVTWTDVLTLNNVNDVLVTGSGGLGYGVGSGGTVTQATSKSTAVTLNKPSGQITMNNASLGAGAQAVFQLSNTVIGAADTVVVAIGGGAPAATSYSAWVGYTSAGQAFIGVRNNTAGALAETILINFAIIKGATT